MAVGFSDENAYNQKWEEQHDNKETHPRLGRLLTMDLNHGPQCDRCNQAVLRRIEHVTRQAHFGKGGTEGRE